MVRGKAMEAPLCRTCGERHWSRTCPGVTPSHGNPRVETREVSPPPSIPRRPMIPITPKSPQQSAAPCPPITPVTTPDGFHAPSNATEAPPPPKNEPPIAAHKSDTPLTSASKPPVMKPKDVTKPQGGRPRKFRNNAQKQAAYRARKSIKEG